MCRLEQLNNMVQILVHKDIKVHELYLAEPERGSFLVLKLYENSTFPEDDNKSILEKARWLVREEALCNSE